ncbi:MAG: TonB-dependent receptor [Bacteroidetes bacterium]|nr:TonB-dependent receptor [Bacteroidota bacterium]
MFRHIYSIAACEAMAVGLSAQVTTSSIYGTVSDESGNSLPGATVTATHVPSGTFYGVVSREDGGYTLPNVRVGGPYKIEASFTGYQTYTQDELFLKLGEKRKLDLAMKAGVELNPVEVVGDRTATINADRTGAASYITTEQLQTLPTITRSTADLTRLNPMAATSADGVSFAGRNDQFNNYSLDGSIFNNPFGLDAATPGGQADAQAVSLDAIDQITVNIAPYDVTQSGFTGASIDAVTKSGTNKIMGSVFGYYRNKDMVGVKVDGTDVTRGDLSQLQTGFSIGGPIVKNKVFFFANLEVERRSDLGSYFNANRGTGAGNESRVLASDLENISNLLRSVHGYETGDYENYKHETNNQKGIFKLDFNLSKAHKLTTTFNFLDAFREKPAHPSAIGRRGPDFQTLQFQNSGYRINNKLYSGLVELKSIFGNKFANKFQAGLTAFRDSRDPFSDPFPVLNIGKDGVRYIVAGHEPFSVHNVLDQDVIQVKDNFNIYLSGHTLTLGTSFERFDFNNSFNLTGYGARVFFPDVDIADAAALINSPEFAQEVADARAAFDNNNKNNTWALAETNMGQWAFYAQDEWSVNEKLTLTLGLRADVPLYFDTKEKIEENIARNCCYDPTITYYDEAGDAINFDHTVLPEQKPLLSPRLGFNYEIGDEGNAQLRGGTGLFTGRFPFVWIGNQVANPNFFFYCVTDPDFKYPQVWRSNLGYDRKLGQGWTFTWDLIYTKDVHAAMVKNYGLRLPGGTLQGPGSRPIYRLEDRAQVFGGATNAYVFTNTDEGRVFNTAVQLEKTFDSGLRATLAYNYLDAQDAASIDAEISSDAYDRNPANVEHSNTPVLAPSLYGNKHRVVGSLYQKFSYGNMATHIALFMEYVQGGRYSYTYSGDINNDGSGLNDLIYIPTDSEIDQMNFGGDAGAQRGAFKKYIAQDDYLSENRGGFAEKYGAVSPWYSRFDLRVMQELGLSNGHSISLSLDVLNFGNLLSSKWGVRQAATSTGLAQPIGVSVDGATGTPTYSFDASLDKTFFNDFSLASRWQAQLGLRYNF